jgi:hypothetical protein
MLINNRIEEPYNRLPPDGPLPIISKTLAKSKLTPKFWKLTQNLYDNNSIGPQEQKIDHLIKNKLVNISSNVPKTKDSKIISNLKKNRAKTPAIKNSKIKNINNPKIKKHKSFKKSDNTRNNNNNDIKMKNFNNIKSSNNCISKSLGNLDYKNYNNKEIDMLKKTILKLEEELNKKEMIIEMQREERVKLTQKVDELERIVTSLININ